MGKSTKPLSILIVDRTLMNSEAVKTELIDKGHDVQYLNLEGFEYDVIIGPVCWRIIPTLGKLSSYLKLMLAGVRAIRYPKESK